MKQYLLIFIISLLISISHNDAVAQNNAKNDSVNQIETKNRIEALEKIIEEQKSEYLNQQKSLEDKFELKNAILKHEKDNVGWWLTGLAIIITFFGVVLPFFGLFIGKRLYDNIDKQKNESKEDIKELIINTEKRVKELEDVAYSIIENLKNMEIKAKESSENIEKVKNEINDIAKQVQVPKLNDDKKQEITEKAAKIENNVNLSHYERDQALLFRLYFSKKYTRVISHINDMMKKYKKEINLEFYYTLQITIAESYFNINDTTKSKMYLMKTLDFWDENDFAWHLLGKSNVKERNYFEALECYKKAIKYSKGNIIYRIEAIELLIILNKLKDANNEIYNLKKSIDNENLKSSFDFILEFYSIVIELINDTQINLDDKLSELLRLVNYNKNDIILWSFDELKVWFNTDDLKIINKEKIKQLITKIEDWVTNYNPNN